MLIEYYDASERAKVGEVQVGLSRLSHRGYGGVAGWSTAAELAYVNAWEGRTLALANRARVRELGLNKQGTQSSWHPTRPRAVDYGFMAGGIVADMVSAAGAMAGVVPPAGIALFLFGWGVGDLAQWAYMREVVKPRYRRGEATRMDLIIGYVGYAPVIGGVPRAGLGFG